MRFIAFEHRIIKELGTMENLDLKTIRKNFGTKIRHLRIIKGWSQEVLANNCGLHRTYVGAIERGERNVSLNNIAKIANALDVELYDLFTESAPY